MDPVVHSPSGPLLEIPLTGRPVTLWAIVINYVADAKIVETGAMIDDLGVQQLDAHR